MKTDIKLIKLKEVKTPDFREPKGEKYFWAMNEIRSKVEEKRATLGNIKNEVSERTKKINRLKNNLVMADDEFEKLTIRKEISEQEEKLNGMLDFKGLDIQVYAEKLINAPEILELKKQAEQEYLEIEKMAKEYQEELDKQYKLASKDLNRFLAGIGSDSTTKRANVNYYTYKNN